MRSRQTAVPRTFRSLRRRGVIWTAFIMLMMAAGTFPTLVDPAFAELHDPGASDSITAQDPPLDSDADGITDEEEAIYGTNPNAADSDSDGIPDYDEIFFYGTDPLNADTDGDGLFDYDEVYIHGTDPLNPDTDGDGVPDGQDLYPNLAMTPTPTVTPAFTPTPSPTATFTPTPTATFTPTPGMGTTSEGDGASVVANYWECPDAYNPASSGDRAAILATCNLFDGSKPVAFQLAPTFPAEPQTKTAPPGGNSVTFEGIEEGSAQLSLVNGTLPATVYCESIDELGNGDTTRPYAQTSTMSGQSTSVLVDAGHLVTCDWFANVQPTAALTVHYWECPHDYDPTSGDQDAMRAACDLDYGDAKVFVTLSDTTETELLLAPGQPADLADIPPGLTNVRYWTTMHPLAALYCEGHDEPGTGAVTRPYTEVEHDGNNGADIDMLANEQVTCDVFARLHPTVDIVHTKYVCPPDYDVTQVPLEQLRAQCDEPVEDVSFTIDMQEYSVTRPVDVMANNSAVFMDFPGGPLFVQENADGLAYLAHWCYTGPESEPEASSYAPGELNSSNRDSIQAKEGGYVLCDWFNQANDYDPYYLLLTKRICPADVPMDEDKAYYDANCDPVPEWELALDWNIDGLFMETDAQGRASVEGVTEGDWLLTEELPDDYGEPFMYCRDIGVDDGEWQRYAMPGGDFDGSFAGEQPGEECHIYNLLPGDDDGNQPPPEDRDNLRINKRICPAGYDLMAAGSDPLADCPMTAPDGIEFTLQDDDPNTPDLTDRTGSFNPGNSYVTFNGLAPGPHTITETEDPRYKVPVLWSCEGYESATSMPISEGWSYQMDVPADPHIACEWLNIPVLDEDPDLATLSIDKYRCEEGYDPSAPGADPLTDCEPGPNGVLFTLADEDPNTSDLVAHTGDGGEYRAVFGNIDPGDYTLTEYLDPIFARSFLWTCDGITNGAMMPWSTTDSYDLSLAAGDVVTCHWFNVNAGEEDEDDDGFSVTLFKLQCDPGTMSDSQDPAYYAAQCVTEHPNVPFVLTDGAGSRPFESTTMGEQLDDVVPTASGQFVLMEEIPDGFGDPVGYCQPVNGPDGTPQRLLNGILTVAVPAGIDDDWHCWYYNIPEEPGMVTIHKWDCPEGMEIERRLDAHQGSCITPLDTVEFTLVDSTAARPPQPTLGGVVAWTDVAIGAVTVVETIPLGYDAQPFVSCRFEDENATPLVYSVYNGILTATFTEGGQHITCNWFNQYEGPGELAIHTWECPAGYDRTAWNADPATDCATPANGVTFVLDQPEGNDLQSTTGDSLDGAVAFGGLMPGQYTVSEMVPEGTVDVFVLDCVGMDTAYVHPVPLSVGPNLAVSVGAGDSIRCDWYNVPGHDPASGWMTVTMYQCSTPAYVSDIDCLVYAGGQQFDLQMLSGNAWVTVRSGTTDAAGRLTFAGLAPGDYLLYQPGQDACLVRADSISPTGHLGVSAGASTTVKIYTCGSVPSIPKTPTKYPNTGVGPLTADLRTVD